MWLSPCLGEGGEFEIHQRRTQHSTSTRLRQLWLDAYFFSFFCCQGGGGYPQTETTLFTNPQDRKPRSRLAKHRLSGPYMTLGLTRDADPETLPVEKEERLPVTVVRKREARTRLDGRIF